MPGVNKQKMVILWGSGKTGPSVRHISGEAGRISREDLKGTELQVRSAERSRKQEEGVAWHQCKVYSFHNDAHAAYGNNEELAARTLNPWPSGLSRWKITPQDDDDQAPSSHTAGNHGPGHCTGTFSHSFHSSCTTAHFFGTF